MLNQNLRNGKKLEEALQKQAICQKRYFRENYEEKEKQKDRQLMNYFDRGRGSRGRGTGLYAQLDKC